MLWLGGCSVFSVFSAFTAERSPHESIVPTSSESSSLAPAGADVVRIDTGGGLRIVDLSFDVFRVDLSLSLGRDSRKIWNHVDEMCMDSEKVALFARNGIRIGIAPRASWSAIQALLQALHAKTYKSVLVPLRGAPLLIKTGAVTKGESMFMHTSEGRLVGKTFYEGDKIISVDYAFQPQFGGSTELQIGFEIRHDKGVMTWTRDGGVIRQVPAVDLHVFEELVAPLTVETGQCLVIGPGDEARVQSLLGGRFLTVEHDHQAYESVFFVTPVPYQTKGARQPEERRG